MTNTSTLTAERREDTGKGAARALRRNGKLPGIIYGRGKETTHIVLDAHDLTLLRHKGGFLKKLLDLKIGNETVRALPKDLQLNPVTDRVEHVDFLRVDAHTRVKVQIPVTFKNRERCIGLKRGGTLNIVRHEVECFCTPEAIPDYLEFDLADFNIGDSIHISRTTLPENVQLVITDRDFTVATVAGRSSTSEEEETTPAEGESEGETVEAAAKKS